MNKNQYPLFFLRQLLCCVMVVGLITACTLPSGQDQSAQMTQMAVNVQGTVLAQQMQQSLQETNMALQGTQVAQSIQATLVAQQLAQLTQQVVAPTPDFAATEQALNAQATAQAQQPTAVPLTMAPPPTESSPQSTEASETEFEEWMKTASILLYEDMAGYFDTTRYVKQALDGMGLPYVDVKDYSGRFKEQILTGGPGGKGWDLIITAAEGRRAVSGEFWDYLNDALNLGSSLIIETYILDTQAGGRIGTLLSRCGIEFQRDWFNPNLADQMVSILDPTNPILHEPNDGIVMRVTDYWGPMVDMGDLVRKIPGSTAKIVMGIHATEKDSYGVLTVCMDGRLILQTFSTHQYKQEMIIRLWQNYIYNTLKARYLSKP